MIQHEGKLIMRGRREKMLGQSPWAGQRDPRQSACVEADLQCTGESSGSRGGTEGSDVARRGGGGGGVDWSSYCFSSFSEIRSKVMGWRGREGSGAGGIWRDIPPKSVVGITWKDIAPLLAHRRGWWVKRNSSTVFVIVVQSNFSFEYYVYGFYNYSNISRLI